MLKVIRAGASTWAVRILLLVLAGAFATWGIGSDMLTRIGANSRSVATAGDVAVAPEDFARDFARAVQQATRRSGAEIPPEQRRAIADDVLSVAITQKLIRQFQDDLGLGTSDDQVVREVRAIPVFHDPRDQRFDRDRFEQSLRNQGVNEAQFMDLVRRSELNQQLLEAVRAGALAPDALARQVFAFENERRSADAVFFPFAAEPAPEPDEAAKTRWYANHPDRYSTPEYRRIKLVALSPDALAKTIAVTEDELRAAYAEHRDEFDKPASRSAEIVTVETRALADNIATAWRAGAGWDAIQKLAEGHGSAIALDDASPREFPDPALADAVFAASAGTIAGPDETPGGFRVFRVTKAEGGTRVPFEQARAGLRDRLAAEKATAEIYDRSSKLDDLLASGATLDELPGDLGLVAATGTLDASGKTPDGTPAPLPGPDPLREALIREAFEAHPNDPPKLQQVKLTKTGTEVAYYAMTLDEVTPPKLRPMADVRAQVAADLAADIRRRGADRAATALRTAAQDGTPFADAAAAAHMPLTRLPPSGRQTPGQGVAKALLGPLFASEARDPLMLETDAGFIVAIPAAVTPGDPNADPLGFQQLRGALAGAIASDVEATFEQALRAKTPARVNRALFDQIVTR